MWGQPAGFTGYPVVQNGVPSNSAEPSPAVVTPKSEQVQTNKPPAPNTETVPQKSPETPAAQPERSPLIDREPASGNTTEHETRREPITVPGPMPEGEAEQSTTKQDQWRTTPEDRPQPPAQVEPLGPPDRRPAPRQPGVDLGTPGQFPELPDRGDMSRQFDDQRPVATNISRINGRPVNDGKPVRPEGWQLTLRTTGNRPLQTATASGGSGPRVFLMGSLSGLETESVVLLDQLMKQLAQGELPKAQVFMLRTPNPDGIAEHVRTNVHGVELNRNFPSTRFTAVPTQQTGTHPASELETQNVMRLLRDFEPERVIHVRSSIGQRPLVLMNPTAAKRFAQVKLPDADYAVYTGDYKAGSVEEFCAVRMGIEIVTILLPVEGFESFSAGDLMSLVQPGGSPSGQTDKLAKELAKPSETTAQKAPISPPGSQPQPDGARGFVQILPPPPDVVAGGEDPRYYELPPPPESVQSASEQDRLNSPVRAH